MSVTTITVLRPANVEAKFLKVEAEPRYWEDASVNGKPESDDNPTIPCRTKGCWTPLIELSTGKIVGWPGGTTAEVHYKVCDAGRYALLDESRTEIVSVDGYVPRMMAPGGNGYGDYIIMSIGSDGTIADWQIELDEFETAARKGGDA